MLQVQAVYLGQVSAEAEVAHQRATEIFSSGKYDEAILALAKIQEMEPKWPRPAYDTAFAYLLSGDYAQAAELGAVGLVAMGGDGGAPDCYW